METSILGHAVAIENLKQLADRGALSHSYLFCGPAMVGKKRVAQWFAHYLEQGGIERKGVALSATLSDGMIIEPGEGGSIGIDAVRDIKNFLWQKPNVSARRTLIINDAELLTTEAQNALLKITEEPPASALLILITSDSESLMPTILSRFQKIYFGLVAGVEKRAMGKPGLAWRLAHDEAFAESIALAEKFLKSPVATRRDLIKKIIEPEDFDLRKFLDAVIIVLAWNSAEKKNAALWHKTLALYERQTNFSLNPRLQLENLLV